jgi:hypothetical protein
MEAVRRLREMIGRYWETVSPPYLNSLGTEEAKPLDEEERLWNAMLKAGGCTSCTVKPKGFIEGPSAGLCQNVFCPHCGQGYNLTPLVHRAELIHRDARYIVVENDNARPAASRDDGRRLRPTITNN